MVRVVKFNATEPEAVTLLEAAVLGDGRVRLTLQRKITPDGEDAYMRVSVSTDEARTFLGAHRLGDSLTYSTSTEITSAGAEADPPSDYLEPPPTGLCGQVSAKSGLPCIIEDGHDGRHRNVKGTFERVKA